MGVYAGLDGGSTYLKAALIDHTGRVLNTGVKSTGIDNNGSAKNLLERLCREAGISHIDYTMATGYSRKILETSDDRPRRVPPRSDRGYRRTGQQSDLSGCSLPREELFHE